MNTTPCYIRLPLLEELASWRKAYLIQKAKFPYTVRPPYRHPYQTAREALQQKVKLP